MTFLFHQNSCTHKSDGVISYFCRRILAVIYEKPFVHGLHPTVMLLKLSETARKLQKLTKNTRIYGRGWNELLTLTAHVNQMYL